MAGVPKCYIADSTRQRFSKGTPLRLLCTSATRIGAAAIYFNSTNQRYHVLLTEEDLGNYPSIAHAIDDLVGGHTWSHSTGVDTSTLEIPEDFSEWTRAE